MGLFLIVDSVLKLLSGEHPPIGMVELFDWQVWLGWLMIAALLWSAIPVMIIGQHQEEARRAAARQGAARGRRR